MFRRTFSPRVRFVVLSWTSDGSSVGKALPKLGLKCYNLRYLMQEGSRKQHPQRWANLLRPHGEVFEAEEAASGAAAAAATVKPQSVAEAAQRARTEASPLVQRSRLAAHSSLGKSLGLTTPDKLRAADIAGFDAIVGLPVSAITDIERLVDFFPQYTKFILVEESQKEKWFTEHCERAVGVVAALTSMRGNQLAAINLELFKHLAWPGSAASPALAGAVDHRLDKATTSAAQTAIAVNFPTLSRTLGVADGDAALVSSVGDLDVSAVEQRKKVAVDALAEFERQVKLKFDSSPLLADRLYVCREGDGWLPLIYFCGKESDPQRALVTAKGELSSSAAAELGEFPDVSHGGAFLDTIEFRIRKANVVTKLFNVAVIVAVGAVAWYSNAAVMARAMRFVEDMKKK